LFVSLLVVRRMPQVGANLFCKLCGLWCDFLNKGSNSFLYRMEPNISIFLYIKILKIKLCRRWTSFDEMAYTGQVNHERRWMLCFLGTTLLVDGWKRSVSPMSLPVRGSNRQ
jgi:hypothetical protein